MGITEATMGFESVKIVKRGRLSKIFPVGMKAYRSGGRLIVEFRVSDALAQSLGIGTEYQFCEIRRGTGADSGKLMLRPVNAHGEWEWHAGNGYVKLVVRGERLGYDAPYSLTAMAYEIAEGPDGTKCLFLSV